MSSCRWFQNLTGQEAEALLSKKGRDGSFLCRPSTNNKDNYTLSVRRNGSVTHIKVQKSGDYYHFYSADRFTSLSELVEFYMVNELREANGELIELLYPMNFKGPTSERWFHGNMSGAEAEKLMLEKGKHGSYLIRESVRQPGDYVLSIRSSDSVRHVMIRNIDGKYDVGGGILFETIADLVEYYRENAMVAKTGGTVVHLKQPFNATKVLALSIGDRVVELHKENLSIQGRDGFWEEFEQLQGEDRKHQYSKKIGKSPENIHKNRFRNILPFDHTRVVLLDGDPDEPSQDYINASYIEGECEHEYIATQGPLDETIYDFWRMVYQENTCVILMLTKEIERGKNRCAKYWPDYEATITTENFTIRNTRETETQEFISREFRLVNNCEPGEEEHIVYHYQYLGWPEHTGTPSNVGSVLGILHEINLKQKNNDYPGPVIMHCSSGIGRTGAFLVIDIIVKLLEKEGLDCEIDVQKTVQHLRTQRQHMVQLEPQYKFIYLALSHFVEMEQNIRSTSSVTETKKRTVANHRDTAERHSQSLLRASHPMSVLPQREPLHTIPFVKVNGELPPPVPGRKSTNTMSGINNLIPRAPPKEVDDSPPALPPPVPARKK